MKGRIVKGIAGFYYVHVEGKGIFECRARGILRRKEIRPLVGDEVLLVEVEDTDRPGLSGHIEEILPRKNQMIRPAVANVDQMLIVFACAYPEPDFNLIDRMLVSAGTYGVAVIICFNKSDLADEAGMNSLRETYETAGCGICFTSVCTMDGFDGLYRILEGKTTVLSGPSGVGKSSMINKLVPEARMETGDLSRRIERGKQTTRHTELFPLAHNGYIMDTPGFSSVFLPEIEKEELAGYFPEFDRFFEGCRFRGCAHLEEPGCAVKAAVEEGLIPASRYDNYKLFYEELKNRRKY